MRVIHRAIRARTWEDKQAKCRLCGCGRDSITHFQECPVLIQLFTIFEESPSPQLIYLGLRRDWRPLAGYAAAYYTILWKFILIQYTRVDTDDADFDTKYIVRATARRTHERIEAYGYNLRVEIERYRSRGQLTPPTLIARYRRNVGPEYSFTETGLLMYTATVRDCLTELNYELSNDPTRILPPEREDAPDRYRANVPTDYWYVTLNPTAEERRRQERWTAANAVEENIRLKATLSNREAIKEKYKLKHL